MNILSDKPKELKEALGGDIRVDYYPPLDVFTSDNAILRTLKGLYCSSKLDLTDEGLLSYVKEMAKPADLPEPVCHTCYNYEDFDNFCKQFIDNTSEKVKVAYDVETTAAPYLSDRYELAGFSLATTVSEGCYVILKSIDYTNPDIDKILERLGSIIKEHNMLVFNLQHEYIATKRCLDVDLDTDCKKIDDAYSMVVLLKTEGFKPDVFKLKLLCNRLLGLDNWATIVDDYIDLAMIIAKSEKIDFSKGLSVLTEEQKELVVSMRDILKPYNYTSKEIISFIETIQNSYDEWAEQQDIIPYSLIPSRMISKYGCYDSCYLLALFDYLKDWVKELTAKLTDSLNKPNIGLAYRETINSQIMSAILTLNGIFISKERDDEVKNKSRELADKYYDKLWDIKSDVTGDTLLKEYVKIKFKNILEKKYILPLKLVDLIPEGWEFIKTTPTLYSFECRAKSEDAIAWAEDSQGLKPCNKEGTHFKLLQKHLLPFDSLDNEEELLEEVYDDFIADSIKNDGSLQKNVFKPMSGPAELYTILNREFKYSHFMDRVVLYEYHNIPKNKKSADIDKFLEEHLLFDFDTDVELYCKYAKRARLNVLDYVKKQYSYKELYEKLLEQGIKSFSSPIIAYIYNIYTATGCSVKEPKHAVFDFICKLKISRRYGRMVSTFIKGSSGGYSIQMRVFNDSIQNKFLRLQSTSVIDEEDQTKETAKYLPNTSNVVFGKWFANVADTNRWTATVHNVPAGPYCKRRFVSRYKGGLILANDMSQAEVRELAAVSKCQKLLETVSDPSVDIHKRTASLAFNVPYDEVTSTQRKQTKEGIFSIVYGRELESLAQSLFKGDKVAAQRLMDAIFKVYPEIPVYLKNALKDVKEHGYLVTRRGEPIFINPYTETGKNKGDQAITRNCQNYAIQGGASFWCSGTLYNVQKLINKYELDDKIKIICYIHDSIEIDVSPDVLDTACQIMNYAFNELATKQYHVPTSSDTVLGISMGEELDFKRINKNHYILEGNNSDIVDTFKQLELTYNVDIIDKEIGEEKTLEDNTDWIFIPRSEAVWYNSVTPAKYEFKLTNKI